MTHPSRGGNGARTQNVLCGSASGQGTAAAKKSRQGQPPRTGRSHPCAAADCPTCSREPFRSSLTGASGKREKEDGHGQKRYRQHAVTTHGVVARRPRECQRQCGNAPEDHRHGNRERQWRRHTPAKHYRHQTDGHAPNERRQEDGKIAGSAAARIRCAAGRNHSTPPFSEHFTCERWFR